MTRPAIRVNQLGYLPGAPQRATLVTGATAPLEFTVSAGEIVWRGWSQPWPQRPEPTSGLAVHVLDFTAACVRGDDVRIRVGETRSHPFRVATDVYERLAVDALRFFRLMRCAHPDTAVGAWTGPDAERLYPGWHPTGPFDVSGGWYDAGDYGKYVVSGSLPAWQLLGVAPDECRWQLDWLLRMLVPPGQPLAGMAFHRVHSTEWSPLPGLPHDDPTTRVLHRPSTAATLHVAAVAAAGARTFAALDPPYAARLLAAARRAHAAAHAHPRLIARDDQGRFGGGPYGDDRLDDDFYWAAAELWLATGERAFLDELTGWTTSSAATRSGRATSPDTAPTPPGTSAPASSPTVPRRARWRAGRTPAKRPGGRPTPASSDGLSSAATSTSPRRRPPTTSASAGTRRSPTSPPH